MAKQPIGTGANANDGNGDTLRIAGGKINDNFSEIYTYFGDGNNLTFGSSLNIKDSQSNVGAAGTIDFGSQLNVSSLSVGIVTVTLADTGVSAASYSNANITVDAQGRITSASDGGVPVTDGDKGDITVSNNGATWTIDNGVISTPKIATNAINADKIANDAVGLGELSATGTPSTNTYLRGDNTWATITIEQTGISSVFDDPSPRFAANIDLNANDIIGATSIGATNLNITGVSTFSNIYIGDTDTIHLGDSNELQIYHDIAGASYLTNSGTGNLNIRSGTTLIASANGSNEYARFTQNQVDLYYQNTKTFSTVSAGATVHGTFYTEDANVLNLTNLNEVNVSGISTFHSNAYFKDNISIWFGDGANPGVVGDLQIKSDGTTSSIEERTSALRIYSNDLYLQDYTDSKVYLRAQASGSVELYHNNVKKFETIGYGVSVTGGLESTTIKSGITTVTEFNSTTSNKTFEIKSGYAKVADDMPLNFGDGSDFVLRHDTTGATNINEIKTSTNIKTLISVPTQGLEVKKNSGDVKSAAFYPDGSSELYHNNVKRIETTSEGVNLSGIVTAVSGIVTYYGDGSGLSNLPAGQLTGALPAIDGSALTGITASGTGIVVQEEGTNVGTAATINFVGTGVTATFGSGIATVTISTGGGGTYGDSDVDTHLNQSNPTSGYVLSWDGSDYAWVAQSGGGSGITTANISADTLNVSGVSTFSSNVIVDGTNRIQVGDSSVQLYRQNNDLKIAVASSYNLDISANVTTMYAGSNADKTTLKLTSSGAAELYHDSSKKLETTTAGIAVSGIVTATSSAGIVTYYGDGQYLTGINATGGSGITTDSKENTYAGIGVATNFGASASSNTLFGYIAGSSINNGSNNAFFGAEAGKRISGNYNTALGAQSLSTSVSGTSNVAIGYQAAKDLTIGSDNVFVGAQAARLTLDSSQSVAVGAFAAAAAATMTRSIAIGDGTCYQGGTNNIGIGVQNLQKGGNSTGIIGIGYRAARYCAGDHSIHIGVEAGRGYASSPWATGGYNLSLGYRSLYSISSGNDNIAIGHSSGGVDSGSNNILIGNNVQVSSASTSNQVIIGDSNITKFSIPGIGVTLKDNGGTPTQGHVLTVDANGEASFAAASGGGGGSGDYSEVAGIATYTSEWTLGADGTNHYTFTGPGLTGAENDPALYLTRGQQYKFYNNSGGHPFRIQSTPNGSAGTEYNDGIPTNNVGTGSTLTWDVQFDAPNKLYYQCTSHPDMGGPIYIIPRTEPAVGVRTEVSGTTGSVGAAATTNLNIDGFKSYGLLKVGISSAAWVRLYVDEASRTSDADRSYLSDPSPGSGLIAEVRTETSGISTFLMTPGVIGWNNDVSIGSTIYTAVTNNESAASTITVDLTVVKMED